MAGYLGNGKSDLSVDSGDEYKKYYLRTSSANRFASLLAAGDYYFMESCVKERAIFNATRKTSKLLLSEATDTELCFYKRIDQLLKSSCRDLF